MTFRDNVNRLCKDKNTTLTAMIRALGYSSSKATAINSGSIPKESTMLEMAEYLDCSVMDFFDDGDEKKTDENLEIIIEGYHSLSKSNQHKLLACYYQLIEGEK